jgi:hypothetical protein
MVQEKVTQKPITRYKNVSVVNKCVKRVDMKETISKKTSFKNQSNEVNLPFKN